MIYQQTFSQVLTKLSYRGAFVLSELWLVPLNINYYVKLPGSVKSKFDIKQISNVITHFILLIVSHHYTALSHYVTIVIF